jgi:hypothetical protein
MTIKWLRPSGTEIETNDRDVTIEYCESLGFEKVNEPKEAPKKKAGRSKKEAE